MYASYFWMMRWKSCLTLKLWTGVVILPIRMNIQGVNLLELNILDKTYRKNEYANFSSVTINEEEFPIICVKKYLQIECEGIFLRHNQFIYINQFDHLLFYIFGFIPSLFVARAFSSLTSFKNLVTHCLSVLSSYRIFFLRYMHWLIDDSCMFKLCIMEDTNSNWRLNLDYNHRTCYWCCSICLIAFMMI